MCVDVILGKCYRSRYIDIDIDTDTEDQSTSATPIARDMVDTCGKQSTFSARLHLVTYVYRVPCTAMLYDSIIEYIDVICSHLVYPNVVYSIESIRSLHNALQLTTTRRNTSQYTTLPHNARQHTIMVMYNCNATYSHITASPALRRCIIILCSTLLCMCCLCWFIECDCSYVCSVYMM